jgi:hypothetical protein
MALVVNPDNFGKVWQEKVLMNSFLSLFSIENQMAYLIEDVKRTMHLPTLDITNAIKQYDCDFTPTVTWTLDERLITAVKLKNEGQICFDDLNYLFDEAGNWKPRPGAHNGDNPTFEQYIQQILVEKTAEDTEVYIWQATTAGPPNPANPLTLFDGLLTIMDNEVTGATLYSGRPALTPANVLDEINGLYALINQQIFLKPSLKNQLYLGVSAKTLNLINIALTQPNVNYPAITRDGSGNLAIHGIPIKASHGITDTRMFFTFRDNLFIGTDLVSDFAQVRVEDARPRMVDYLNYKMAYVVGTQIYNPDYITLWAQA